MQEPLDHKKAESQKQDIEIIKYLFLTINTNLNWKSIGPKAPDFNVQYTILFNKETADTIFGVLEENLQYFTGDLSKLKVYGKWHAIPRKQVTFGDEGVTYKYSGITAPALPWPPEIAEIRNLLSRLTGHYYNFVVVNRYKDGNDRIGEHKDDEKELDESAPIASISLGQPRPFYFKHQDLKIDKLPIDKVTLTLEHGSLLLMNQPTNKFWYHALPPRKKTMKPRINLTFRKIITSKE